ncbi:hypothetical protein [Thalassiella azotivora]
MLDLPRSVRLATWAAAVRRGEATLADAVVAVRRDDEPHGVAPAPDAVAPGTVASDAVTPSAATSAVTGLRRPLPAAPDPARPDEALTALVRWAASPDRLATVVLPVPGHALGLPGPPSLNVAALDAGECVLVHPLDARGAARGPVPGPASGAGGTAGGAAGGAGLVPEVEEFGSWLEPGASVTWRVHAANPRRVTDLGSLSEAERALREALVTSTEVIAGLDVERWRPDAADRIAAIRDGGLDRRVVPPGTPGRALRVLATAARVRAVVELAREDDGAAVSGWQADRRSHALREVDQVARRALVAAVEDAALH